MDNSLARLPKEFADQFTKPFARFLRVQAAGAAVLLLFTLIALGVANSPWSPGFLAFWDMPVGLNFGAVEFSRSLKDWINDGVMTFFFFVVALELKRELVLGELRDLRVAALSLAAALGGMLGPAALYLVLQYGQAGAHGWGSVMATDTAFVIGCLAMLGSRIPQSLRLFLLSLAIFDDIGAILVVAIGYGGAFNWVAIGLSGLGLAVIFGLGRLGIRSLPAYYLVGALIWLSTDLSGIHPTIVGVVLGLMTPTRGWVSDRRLRAILDRLMVRPPGQDWSGDTRDRRALRLAGVATREAVSPVERLEISLHPWVSFFVMPLFAFANAGVPLSIVQLGSPVSVAIFAGLVVGKPVGVLGACWVAVRIGAASLPGDLSWRVLVAGALLTGIGFTMALFIADLAFEGSLINGAKLGILSASLVSAISGVLALAFLTSRGDRSASA